MMMGIFLGLLLIIVLIILVVLFFVYLIDDSSKDETRGLNQECTNTEQCANGLSCQNGSCKAEIGSYCQTLSDCISGATACQDNTCISNTLSWYNEPCRETSDCQSPLICYNKLCKAPIDGPCDDITDCVPNAESCTNHICQGPKGKLNEPCPCDESQGLQCDPMLQICRYEQGETCQSDCDCLTGLICDNGVCSKPGDINEPCTYSGLCMEGLSCSPSGLYKYDAINEAEELILTLPNETIVSYTKWHNNELILLTDGRIMIKKGKSLSSISNPVKVTDIFVVGNHLYGLYFNTLYEAKWTINHRALNWLKVTWFEKEVIHYSVSADNFYLWLQAKYKTNDKLTDGYLFYFNGHSAQPKLEKNLAMDQHIFRHYGYSVMAYIDHDRYKRKVTRYPRKDKIDKVYQVAMAEDGSLAIIKHNERHTKSKVFSQSGQTYLIRHRLCQ